MHSIVWELSKFNISMKSKYENIYALEDDINFLSGSSNFSEMDTLEWFLISNKNKKISFLSLGVPSFFSIYR